MARYIKTFQLDSNNNNILFNQISSYLNSEGYTFTQYNGENVFEKGIGMISGPTYFKFLFEKDSIRLESWMKYAIFPGLYIGELSTTGFVGSASKGAWKKRIAQVEAIISQYGYETNVFSPQMQNIGSNTLHSGNPIQSSSLSSRFCARCGAELQNGTVFCSSCGQQVTVNDYNQMNPSQQQNSPKPNIYSVQQYPVSGKVSKKDYINN